MARAHACLTRDAQARTDAHGLRELLERIAVLPCRRVDWSHGHTGRDHAELVGVAVNDTGGLVPLRVAMLVEQGRWRIRWIERIAPGAAMAGWRQPNQAAAEPLHDLFACRRHPRLPRIAPAGHSRRERRADKLPQDARAAQRRLPAPSPAAGIPPRPFRACPAARPNFCAP